MLPVVVAQSSSGVVVIRYILPVWYATLRYEGPISFKFTYLPNVRLSWTEFSFLLLKGHKFDLTISKLQAN